MGAPQFFTEPADLVSDEAVLRGDEARHAAHVLRLRVGERLLVADGAGRAAEATAAEADRRPSPERPTPFVSDNRVG
jgi:16S rRNA (uracil1498-N3)-methyltransferase